jgi:2'-5' RNA ligase
VLPLDDESIKTKFKAARQHLSGYLMEPYPRQPHITLFVCGFLVEEPHYNDDFTRAQLHSQFQALGEAGIQPFEIEIGGLNSFASAPFLDVSDPQGSIARLREVLSRGAREFRTAPYTPHLTVGLYAGAFPSARLSERIMGFPSHPIKLEVGRIAFATYQAQEIAGLLTPRQEIVFS